MRQGRRTCHQGRAQGQGMRGIRAGYEAGQEDMCEGK